MAGSVGRPNPLYGWNTYDWPQKLKYTTLGFSALTMSAQTQTTATCTVTAIGPLAAGSKVGIMFGTGMGSGGYNRKLRLVDGPGPIAFKLNELSPGTQYHVAAYGVDNQGTSYVGPNSLLTTNP